MSYRCQNVKFVRCIHPSLGPDTAKCIIWSKTKFKPSSDWSQLLALFVSTAAAIVSTPKLGTGGHPVVSDTHAR